MKDSKNKIIIVILITLIVCLLVGVVFLYVRYDDVEDKYDDLIEDIYEKDGNNYLPNDNSNGNDNSSDNSDINNSNNNNDNTNSKEYISQNDALQIVLKDLNISKDKIYDLDIELEYKNRYGTLVYEVSFDYNLYEYEYYLDPYTGKIIDSLKSRD